MAPSPRKTTAPAFEHSWSEADAAILDPTALPISKIPRAWERKQETKTIAGGKQKKVWRRYSTRSRTANVALEDDDHDDAHDSRFRPIKKLQRMSPQAIEKSTKLKGPKKNAFKATRWDRRKSVLPRKKITRTEPIDDDIASNSSEDHQASEEADISSNFSEMDASTDFTPESVPVPGVEDRKPTFTFSMRDQEETSTDDRANLSASLEDPEVEQEATLVNFFRSPAKNSPSNNLQDSPGNVTYPELPEAMDMEISTTHISENMSFRVNAAAPKADIDGSLVESNIPTDHTSEDTAELSVDSEQITATEAPLEAVEVSYQSLAAEESNQEHNNQNGASEEMEDESGSEGSSISSQDEEGSTAEATETFGEEEFTEASLQLHIQRDMGFEQKEQPPALADTIEDHTESVSTAEEMEVDVSAETSLEAPSDDTLSCLAKQNIVEDITDGLTLGSKTISSREPAPRKLLSPSPPPVEHCPDDTMTVALDDDTAMLKDFLSRAAASKASKAATISRRESLQNRRDSDVVRHALASPRKVLEDKDPNSPAKYDNEVTLDLSQTLTLNMDQPPLSPSREQASAEATDDTAAKGSRRSSRTRKSRLPALASTQPVGPSKIAVRRADGGEHVVLKKSDAQELSQLTRANTRKNKQGAFAVSIRLLKISKEASRRASDDDTTDSLASVVPVPGKKYVRWDEQLAYYQEGTDTMANMLAEAESMATPDELSLPMPASKPKIIKATLKEKKTTSTAGISTPKVRRVRGLGATNGTPGKGLLTPASLLPDAVREEKEQQQAATTKPSSHEDDTNRLPKPKSRSKSKTASKAKKPPTTDTTPASSQPPLEPELQPPQQPPTKLLPSLEIAPVGIESSAMINNHFKPTSSTSTTTTTTRRSRLASPKKVKLPPPPSTSGSGDGNGNGKENSNTQQQQQRGVVGIAGATPKKGIPVLMGIPAGMGVVGGSGGSGGGGSAETGLPRRRLRRL